MSTLVFDTESDGFVYESTVLWCIVIKDVEEKTVEKFWGDSLDEGLDILTRADTLICHNIIKHDIPLILKLYPSLSFKGITIIDTLLLSQLLNPDRYGGHGLAAWGERLGLAKPEHKDWSKFSQQMLHRCSEDVEINYRVYNELIKEAGEPIEGVRVYG